MFAKPAKKTSVQPTKQKGLNKPKAVAVKTGVKPVQSKKIKTDAKQSKLKPPPRPDPGYSLYSTDSEDQVAASFKDMEACERMLTHLKCKHKTSAKTSSKSKKQKDKSLGPKPLNDLPPNSDAVTIPGYGFQYGVSQFLHHIQDPNNPSNPLFNYRLVSSTPDPEKAVSSQDSSKPPTQPDQSTQDIPERDISAVSSVPPSQQHVRNMIDMVEIYKQLEMKKYSQLQEASAMSELEKLRSQSQNDPAESTAQMPTSQPSAFAGTGSLGFHVNQQLDQYSNPQTGFQSTATESPFQSGSIVFQSPNMEIGRDSSLAAFQPYLARDSGGFLPPKSWFPAEQQQPQNTDIHVDNVPSNSKPHTVQRSSSVDVIPVQDIPTSGRTEKSDSTNASGGTDYVRLPHPDKDGQTHTADGSGSENIVYEKQNGLFQIHQRDNDTDTESSKRLGKSDPSEKGSIHEAPERDKPHFREGTFHVEASGSSAPTSQNVSELTTPRNQNLSSTCSTSSQGGKIVFIPNDSSTQNVIGYIPSIPFMPGVNQPISLPVTSDNSTNLVPNLSIPSSSVLHQGQSTSQLTGPAGSQDCSGSGYHSANHAKIIAAGDIGVRKLRYLLKELKECGKVTKDVEVGRLVTELDEAVNAIPQLALTFNLQTEVDLAIQPLRTENSQLRRKLRLLNQQLKDKDIAAEEGPKDINFEILHLQTSNEALQKAVRNEQEIKTRLAAEVQYVYAEIHKLKVEKSKWIAELSEKETAQLKLRQETLLETQNLRHDVDLMKKDHEMTVGRLESLEKENHILQITLQQRDAEITRQQDLIESMKESISDLLLELDQSRGGDITWDQNKSFGLHKLARIVEEEGTRIPRETTQNRQTARKSVRTPERRAFDFNTTTTSSPGSTPRLTRAALAYHNKNHMPPTGARMGPDGRVGPASESELDTLVEMHRREKPVVPSRDRESRPHRRTSSSSPVRFRTETLDKLRHQRTASSPPVRHKYSGSALNNNRAGLAQSRERTYGREVELNDDSTSPEDRVYRRVETAAVNRNRRTDRQQQQQQEYEQNSGKRPQEYDTTGRNGESSEVSMPQSRYSVTDYFRKYPNSSETLTSDPGPPGTHYRSKQTAPVTAGNQALGFRTSSIIGEGAVNFSDVPISRNVKQLTLFKGLNYDQTISAIQDDNLSSVSMNSVTTANTVDDGKFRKGIATLDANIAKLQMALQKTKSMLT